MQIVDLCGLSYPTVRAAIDRYKVGGLAAIKPAVRGRRASQGRALNAEQEHALRKLICDKRPEQLKMEFALWSRAAVMQLIEQEYGIKLTVRGVGKYLARWGFTAQKPIKKVYEQPPEAVQAWLNCKVPDDCIDPRRYPLFMARATMRALIADVRATKKESVSC